MVVERRVQKCEEKGLCSLVGRMKRMQITRMHPCAQSMLVGVLPLAPIVYYREDVSSGEWLPKNQYRCLVLDNE